MDGVRKVGRQRIPPEFRKREESLKKALAGNRTSVNSSQALVKVKDSKVFSVQNLETLKTQMDEDVESPSFDHYPNMKSLPFTTSLRALADRSVSGLSLVGSSQHSPTPSYQPPIRFKHVRINSSLA